MLWLTNDVVHGCFTLRNNSSMFFEDCEAHFQKYLFVRRMLVWQCVGFYVVTRVVAFLLPVAVGPCACHTCCGK